MYCQLGGAIDPVDRDEYWLSHADSTLVDASDTEARHDLAHRVCAIREAFEESSILLTDNNSPVSLTDEELEAWRKKVCSHCHHTRYNPIHSASLGL
jgi:hypothetical protein